MLNKLEAHKKSRVASEDNKGGLFREVREHGDNLVTALDITKAGVGCFKDYFIFHMFFSYYFRPVIKYIIQPR